MSRSIYRNYYEMPPDSEIFKIENASKRIKKFFRLAKEMAKESSYNEMRHGAILTRGGRVISKGKNSPDYSSFGKRFRPSNLGHARTHAEIDAVYGIPKNQTNGADLFVVRISKEEGYMISKPCPMCESVLSFVGVKRVFFSMSETTFSYYKI